ncbi:MAG: leucine-rich repeat protein, partial [Oscillospiraceae bacterium]|nr:leucine-rich repeat protein [Oscillospiraceae bacterium]
NNSDNAVSLFDIDESLPSYTYMLMPVDDITITNSNGKTATITDEYMESEIDDLYIVTCGETEDDLQYLVTAPSDTYTVTGTNNEQSEILFANEDMSVAVTHLSSIPVEVSSDLKTIFIMNESSEGYSIKYKVYDNYFDEVTITGESNGTVNAILDDSQLNVTGISSIDANITVSDQIVNVACDDLSDSETIISFTDQGVQLITGDITVSDETNLPERLKTNIPEYDLMSGEYNVEQTLTFTKDDNTIIYYTTDGSEPNENSNVYIVPIEITENMTIKAIAKQYGYSDSDVITLEYEITENSDDNIIIDGICGDNLTWTLENDGVLTISGTGDMTDYEWGSAPWYEYSDEITQIVIDDDVTSIGNHAFEDFYTLDYVTIGRSVVSIGDYAFSWSNLTSITIPDAVEIIGAYAFSDCYNLEKTIIGSGVLNIGEHAFCSCYALSDVVIGSNVVSIGDYAFCWDDSLTSIVIPNSIASIGESAFNSCESITDVYYGGSEDEWAAISIGLDNDYLLGATIHCSFVQTELPEPMFTVSDGAVTNTGEEERTVDVIIASYDDNGYLLDVSSKTVKFDAGETIDYDLAENERIFVWNSLAGMYSLVEE